MSIIDKINDSTLSNKEKERILNRLQNLENKSEKEVVIEVLNEIKTEIEIELQTIYDQLL